MRNHSKFLTNKKQDVLYSSEEMHLGNMIDGQVSVSNNKSSSPSLNLKKNNLLYKVSLSPDGNQSVDKKLTTNILEYTNTFIDYRVFKHSFTDNLPATEIYIPWQGTGEQTTLLNATSGFLTPHKMTCHKLIVRTPAIDTVATDIVFGIRKIDSGDTTIDSVCTYDATSNWVSNTNFTINQSDWTASPTIEAGELAGISINADNANIVTSEKHFHITSVWRTEVTI
tara:strand:- start:161 stop:838 length:678 start_codon:yes stop_codon:yes gene_type:complete